jgi:hypothetical protein
MDELSQALKGTFVGILARLFKPVANAETVLTCPPVWVRASGAEALLGIKRDFLNNLVAQKKVTAKKADKLVIYKFADIVKAIEAMDTVKKGK